MLENSGPAAVLPVRQFVVGRRDADGCVAHGEVFLLGAGLQIAIDSHSSEAAAGGPTIWRIRRDVVAVSSRCRRAAAKGRGADDGEQVRTPAKGGSTSARAPLPPRCASAG